MTSDRRPRTPSPPPMVTAANGRARYLRFSWRYNTWQVLDSQGRTWRNVRTPLARAYAAAGLPTYIE